MPVAIDEVTGQYHIQDSNARSNTWTPHRRLQHQRLNQRIQTDIEHFFQPTNRIAPSPWSHTAPAKSLIDTASAPINSAIPACPWSPVQPNTYSPSLLRAGSRVSAPTTVTASFHGMEISLNSSSDSDFKSEAMSFSSDNGSAGSDDSLKRRLFEQNFVAPRARFDFPAECASLPVRAAPLFSCMISPLCSRATSTMFTSNRKPFDMNLSLSPIPF